MLSFQIYQNQTEIWPTSGRHILAHFDADSIWVYQAFAPAIADFAVENQRFGGDFSFARMSWIKPSFLWMNYRSGWNCKAGQEKTLAVRLTLGFWEEILLAAVPSSFVPQLYENCDGWKRDLARSDVRLQWDPDHGPRGEKLARRAIQLGLRGEFLRRYAIEPLEIWDATDLVLAGRAHLENGELEQLETPIERVFAPRNPETVRRLGLD